MATQHGTPQQVARISPVATHLDRASDDLLSALGRLSAACEEQRATTASHSMQNEAWALYRAVDYQRDRVKKLAEKWERFENRQAAADDRRAGPHYDATALDEGEGE